MGLFTRSADKKKISATKPNPAKVGTTCSGADAFIAQNGNHFRLSQKLMEKIYGKILRRAEEILRLSGANDTQVDRFFECLRLLLNKRRGSTLPVNVSSEIIQRYREISTLTLVLMFTVKVTAKFCIDKGVQVEHEGEIYTFSPYQNFIYDQFRKIGIVKNNNQTLSNGVIVSLRHAILNDFLYRSPVTIQWFGMFNDMLCIVYRNLENKEEVNQQVFTQITDHFESQFWNVGDVAEEDSSESLGAIPVRSKSPVLATASTGAILPPKKQTTGDNATLKVEVPNEPQLTDTMPVATPQLNDLFMKARAGNAPAKPASSHVSLPIDTKSNILQCKNEAGDRESSKGFQSPLLQKIALKRNVEPDVKSDDETLSDDHISSFVRETLANKNAFILCNIVNADGEIFDSKGLLIDASLVYSSLVKLSGLKKVVIAKQLVAQHLTFITERGKADISHNGGLVVIFKVSAVDKFDLDHVLDEIASENVMLTDISVK